MSPVPHTAYLRHHRPGTHAFSCTDTANSREDAELLANCGGITFATLPAYCMARMKMRRIMMARMANTRAYAR